ncbi:aldehyde dehydrogenase family protein, partial [Aestuariivirga sp.]|uniref:aldehyde dehydrogenase family protein n=1 Tax=Aestuariivirga sp. TaxID=2650926 RepID=UPI0035B390D9
MRRFQQLIDGRFEDGAASFESIDPATGAAWALMPRAGAADVDRAVTAAHRALSDTAWRGLTATQRGKLLFRLADLVAEQAQALAELETTDTGKIIRETSAQIAYVAEYYRYFAGLADKLQGAHLPIDKPDMEVWLRREPIGVVAAVVPWNSQLFLSAVKLAPALAAGCTVVLKASEDGPAPLLEFARLVQQAGFPPGVVNVITGFGPDCGQVLTSHPLVSRIAFTGGPETARHVMRNAAENLAHVTLELGGKSPVVVFDDADPHSTANAVVAGIFAATGQSCVAGSRLIVQRSIKERLLDLLKAKAEAIVIGSPQARATEMGPLATLRQRNHIEAVVAASLASGARLVTGGGGAGGGARG